MAHVPTHLESHPSILSDQSEPTPFEKGLSPRIRLFRDSHDRIGIRLLPYTLLHEVRQTCSLKRRALRSDDLET